MERMTGHNQVQHQQSVGQVDSIYQFKSAYYNVMMAIFGIWCILAAFAAYYLLEEFFKPLLWAVICGIVLFPLKRAMTRRVKDWLHQLDKTKSSLLFALIMTPLHAADKLGASMVNTILHQRRTSVLLALSFPLMSLVLHHDLMSKIFLLLTQIFLGLNAILVYFQGVWAIVAVTCYVVYAVGSTLWPEPFGRHIYHNQVIASIMWYVALAYGCNCLGPLRAPAFLGAFVVTCIFHLYTLHKSQTNDEQRDSDSPSDEASDPETESVTNDEEEEIDSNYLLKWLMYACIFVYISTHLWLLTLLLVPVGVFTIKYIGLALGVPGLLLSTFERTYQRCKHNLGSIIPLPCQLFYKMFMLTERKIISYVKKSMDTVGSLVSMAILGVSIVTIGLFVVVQLYYEAMHMVQLAIAVIQKLSENSPQFHAWLKTTLKVDSVAEAQQHLVEEVYNYSRQYASVKIRSIMDEDNATQANLVEEKILGFFDKLHAGWTGMAGLTNSTALNLTNASANVSVDSRSSESTRDIIDMITQNVFVLYSLIETSWELIASNVSILLSSVGDILAYLVGSSMEMINMFMDATVFLSFLLGLLASSDERFTPLEVIIKYSPNRQGAKRVVEDIEETVSGLFVATLKMAMFYGFYTWLTHTLFELNLVFLPSVLAAICASVPFIGPYLMAVPGVIELWLIRGEPLLALLLLFIHYVPSYFVDDAIFGEIKTADPLLTGMAIAGGMAWWGLEGAIFGPIVLCCILATISVYETLVVQKPKRRGISVISSPSFVSHAPQSPM